MDLGTIIGTIISIIIAILAILTLVVLLFQYKKKKPTWAFSTRQVIGRDAESPPELKYIFGMSEVEEVYQTKIIFFNNGNESYRGDLASDNKDINEPIIIQFKGADILRPPEIKYKSKGVANKFSAEKITKDGQDVVELHFPILNRHDGVLFEVWHTRCEEKPDIPNANVILLKEFIKERPKKLKTTITLDLIFIIGILVLLGYGIYSMNDLVDKLIISSMIVLFLFLPTSDLLKNLRYKRFPGWSRPDKKQVGTND